MSQKSPKNHRKIGWPFASVVMRSAVPPSRWALADTVVDPVESTISWGLANKHREFACFFFLCIFLLHEIVFFAKLRFFTCPYGGVTIKNESGITQHFFLSVKHRYLITFGATNMGLLAWYISGWWFGTCFIFPYIGNNHPNWLIFSEGLKPPTRYYLPRYHTKEMIGFSMERDA